MVVRAALDATPLLGNRTGVGVFTEYAIDALGRRDDVEVSAFAISWRRRHGIKPLLPAGVRAVDRPMPARPLHWAWNRWARPAIEWWTGPVDVVHGTNFVVPPTRRAARVVTVHDLTTVRFPVCDRATLIFPSLVRRAIAAGAWVHTPSSFVAAEVVELLGADPERVRAIHHGIPGRAEVLGAAGTPAKPGPAGAGPAKPGLAGFGPAKPGPAGFGRQGRYILAVGTIEPRKDFPGLVAAFDQLAAGREDLRLVIAGPDGWGADALTRAIAGARHGDRVDRVGWVGDGERRRLLEGAAAFAFPSVYEGFGLPPLEAMEAGVPVVASDAGSLPEVIGDGGVLVAQGDVDALAGALAGLLDDPAAAARMVQRGRARTSAFSWERCGQQLAELSRDARDAQG